MAVSNTFKNKIQPNISTTLTTVYQCPSEKTATVVGMSLANIATTPIMVSVALFDTSTSTTAYIVKNAPIPVGGSLIVVGGDQKVIIENGDTLRVISDTVNSVDAILSVMELNNV